MIEQTEQPLKVHSVHVWAVRLGPWLGARCIYSEQDLCSIPPHAWGACLLASRSFSLPVLCRLAMARRPGSWPPVLFPVVSQ